MTTQKSVPLLSSGDRGAIVAQRIDELRGLLHQRAATAMLLDSRRDFAWLTVGGQNHILYTTETGVAPILLTRDDAAVIAPVNEFDRIVEEEIDGLPLRAERTSWYPGAAGERARELVKGGPIVTATDLADDLVTLRSRLASAEHERLEWIAGVVRDLVRAALADVESGTTEDSLVAAVASAFTRQALRLPVVLVAADDRLSRHRHPLSASAPIRRRVMLVVVAERWGLHVAHTEFRELHPRPTDVDQRANRLVGVLDAMRSATVPGNTLGHVLEAARTAYEGAGMPDEWALHHQGGTIGYQARERIAEPGDETLIEPGMAFAWNPSAVGFKLEETLYLDAHGRQHVLTTTPL